MGAFPDPKLSITIPFALSIIALIVASVMPGKNFKIATSFDNDL